MTRLTCYSRSTGKQTWQEEFESRTMLERAIGRMPRGWTWKVEYQDRKGVWHNTDIS